MRLRVHIGCGYWVRSHRQDQRWSVVSVKIGGPLLWIPEHPPVDTWHAHEQTRTLVQHIALVGKIKVQGES